ncbi:hypothetical protein CEW46_29775 [Bacillus cereus]|nr:hypothetical protein CEW46_29775 [Bacillus cereus]
MITTSWDKLPLPYDVKKLDYTKEDNKETLVCYQESTEVFVLLELNTSKISDTVTARINIIRSTQYFKNHTELKYLINYLHKALKNYYLLISTRGVAHWYDKPQYDSLFSKYLSSESVSS